MESISDADGVPSSKSKTNGRQRHLTVHESEHFVCAAHEPLKKLIDSAREDIGESRRSNSRWMMTLTLLVPLVAAALAGFFQLRIAALPKGDPSEIMRELRDIRSDLNSIATHDSVRAPVAR